MAFSPTLTCDSEGDDKSKDDEAGHHHSTSPPSTWWWRWWSSSLSSLSIASLFATTTALLVALAWHSSPLPLSSCTMLPLPLLPLPLIRNAYLLSEFLFYVHYRFKVLPNANRSLPTPCDDDYKDVGDGVVIGTDCASLRPRRSTPMMTMTTATKRPTSRPPPARYRDCGRHRHRLMLRIIRRIERASSFASASTSASLAKAAELGGSDKGEEGTTTSGLGRLPDGAKAEAEAEAEATKKALAEFVAGWFYSDVEGVSVWELLGGCNVGDFSSGRKTKGKSKVLSSLTSSSTTTTATVAAETAMATATVEPPNESIVFRGNALVPNGGGEGPKESSEICSSFSSHSFSSNGRCGVASVTPSTATAAATTISSSKSFSSSSSSFYHPATEQNKPPLFPRKGDMDLFFSWAFFACDVASLTEPQRSELDLMYSILDDEYGLVFRDGRTAGLVPMRLTLDDVDPTYRLLLVYMLFSVLYGLGCVILRCAGFTFYRAENGGLTYWVRRRRRRQRRRHQRRHEERTDGAQSSPPPQSLPLLFFHGIAPGGLALYLPMLLWGLCRRDTEKRDRTVLLFENKPVSFLPTLEAVNEEDTVRGVLEAMATHLDGERGGGDDDAADGTGVDGNEDDAPETTTTTPCGVVVAGHSFGTFQVTWMLRCPKIRRRVRQVVLMDPVSIVLSEPDVITNFVYGRRAPRRWQRWWQIGQLSPLPDVVSVARAIRPIFLFPVYYVLSLLDSSPLRLVGKAGGFVGWIGRQCLSLSSSSSFSSSSFSPPLLRKLSSLSSTPKSIPLGKYNKIWMVQSELYIEHYLRRNFWWYNNELFLDAIPPDCKVVICVSGKDEILSARKVLREVELHRKEKESNGREIMTSGGGGGGGEGDCCKRGQSDNWTVLHWPRGGHAHCVPRPQAWAEIREAMSRQHETISRRTEEERAQVTMANCATTGN